GIVPALLIVGQQNRVRRLVPSWPIRVDWLNSRAGGSTEQERYKSKMNSTRHILNYSTANKEDTVHEVK
ncbi:MAG TPA: hypothetical protein VN920_00595, partial [Pyrinomonadaceae bacterium]|nr:hypothetical protein [Pyrinomonadaceae bacterium]